MMHTILGIVFLWAAWSHVQDAINPDRLSRTQVRINAGMMAAISLVFAYISLKLAGIL